jgi:hypothetical protein
VVSEQSLGPDVIKLFCRGTVFTTLYILHNLQIDPIS